MNGAGLTAVKRALMALLLALLASSAAARTERYSFDKVHSRIGFAVSHLGFSMSHGVFRDFDGFFVYDPEDLSTARVEVTVSIDSIEMGNALWNRTMLGGKWLDAKTHPTMRFVGTELTRTADDRGSLRGELTLRGVTRPIAFAVQFNRAGVHPYTGLHVVGFSATGSLNRSDFGLVEALPEVGDQVEITLEVEGTRRAPRRGK
jgi:polyisoprenoid-binding protein YceI